MAFKAATNSSAVGSYPTSCGRPQLGILISKPGNLSWAAKVGSLTDRATLREMSSEALLTATRDYSIPKMIDGFEAAIRFTNARRGKRS